MSSHPALLAAQAATAAATDLLQYVRDDAPGHRFGGDVIEALAEALRLAIGIEYDALDRLLSDDGHARFHDIHAAERSQLGQLLAAIRKWESDACGVDVSDPA